MRRLGAWVLLALLATGCPSEDVPDGGVLEGDCPEAELHCVDGETIQYCTDGAWTDPASCPPELAGDPPLEVEVRTYCTADGCRPGG